MNRLCLAIAFSLAATATGGAAAEPSDGPNASFTYSHGQSVAQNYDNFEEVARTACRLPLKESLRVWAAEKAQCEANLIEQAVKSFGISELTELHIAQTKGVLPSQQFASR